MRTIIAPGGLPTFVSKREGAAYDKLDCRCSKEDLNERELYLIQSLVSKNLVKKIVEDKKVYFERMRSL